MFLHAFRSRFQNALQFLQHELGHDKECHVRCTVHGLIDQSCKKNDFTVRTTEPTNGQETGAVRRYGLESAWTASIPDFDPDQISQPITD